MGMPLSFDLSPILQRYLPCHPAEAIRIEAGALDQSAAYLSNYLPSGTWLLVADPTTWELAGARLQETLHRAGCPTRPYLVRPNGAEAPVADAFQVKTLEAQLRSHAPVAAVAVGAGTVNDIVKLATYRHGLPYAVCPTAPSMNGYTSAVAAILVDGVKTTQPCRAPTALIADLDILCRAPYALVAAGFGDLLSKPVSGADWRLGQRLVHAPYSTEAMDLISAADALLAPVAPRLPDRHPQAVARLMASLCLSGLAMELAGSSAPASGGEHLISHYLDMTHYAGGSPNHLHGCQVGVATAFTAALYERLKALDPVSIDIESLVTAYPTWDTQARRLTQHFGQLSAAVLPYAEEKHPAPAQLRLRLEKVKDSWYSLMDYIGADLPPGEQIIEQLHQAQAPHSFAELGIPAPHARDAIFWCRHIRSRYTVLDLAAELGHLDTWTAAISPL